MKTDGLKFQRIQSCRAFTLLEIVTVITIIAILMGLLMPALNLVRKLALETKQTAQIGSIGTALDSYKLDFGDYPPSHGFTFGLGGLVFNDYRYSGAQTLSEAMFGWDLLGVHKNTVYRYDGKDSTLPGNLLYTPDPNAAFLDKRKGPYLDRSNIGVFEPNQIFANVTQANADAQLWMNYTICDVFTTHSKKIFGKTYRIGSPILYFKANPSAINTQLIPDITAAGSTNNIYNYFDNRYLIYLGTLDGKPHKLYDAPQPLDGKNFYKFIRDPMIPLSTTLGTCGKPVHTDTYLLISAGYDGIFGTKDDICNFSPNIE